MKLSPIYGQSTVPNKGLLPEKGRLKAWWSGQLAGDYLVSAVSLPLTAGQGDLSVPPALAAMLNRRPNCE